MGYAWSRAFEDNRNLSGDRLADVHTEEVDMKDRLFNRVSLNLADKADVGAILTFYLDRDRDVGADFKQ